MKFWLCILFIFYLRITQAQVITTFAGNGNSGNTGDGGPATAAAIGYTYGCAFDVYGNFYFTNGNSYNEVRKITPSGIISTVAGTGSGGYNGDGIAATSAKLNNPSAIAFDSLNNIYIADSWNNRVRKIDAVTGIITTIAGNSTSGYSGDGGPATAATFNNVSNICFDKFGNLYVLDIGNNRIRKIDKTGIIHTVAGNGIGGDIGDGGVATNANIEDMVGICTDATGDFYFSESGLRIRKVSIGTGIITEFAGIDPEGSVATGDGGPATAAAIDPFDIAFDNAGRMFVAGYAYNDIRMIDNFGIIHTVAGTGTAGFSGDNGSATAAEIGACYGITLDSCGNLYISDRVNFRIRKVALNPACIPAAVNNIANEQTISIYPNPTYDELNINSLKTPATYLLLSIVGAAMQQGELKEGNNTISIQVLPNGMYMLEIIDEQKNKTVNKIVKQ